MKAIELTLLLIITGPTAISTQARPQDQQIPDVGPSTQVYVEAWKSYVQGDYSRALTLASRGLEDDRRSGSEKGVAEALNLIGTVHYKHGDYEGALPIYLEAAQLAEKAGYTFGLARDWSSVGSTYYRTGQYSLAKKYYEKSLELRKQIGNFDEIARGSNDLANLNEQLGSYSPALSLRLKALELWRRTGNQIGIADVLNDIGWTYDEMGQESTALEYLRNSLSVSRKAGLQTSIFENLENIGFVEAKLGRYREAFANLNASYDGFLALQQQDEVARTLNDLGDTYSRLGDFSKAAGRYQEALRIELIVGNRPVEGMTLAGLMKCSSSLRRSQVAIFYGKEAVNLYQKFRGDISDMDPAVQKSFLRNKENTYRDLADLLIAEGRLPEAQQVLDLVKEQDYFDFIRRSGSDGNSPTSPASFSPSEEDEAQRFHEIADSITAAGEQRSELLAKPTRTSEEENKLKELSVRIESENVAFQQLLDDLSAELKSSDTAEQTVSDLENNANSMQRILGKLAPGTVALYTLVGENKYRVILVTPQVLVAREYPIKATDLRSKVFQFRQLLRSPHTDPLPPARELYKILLGPVETELDGADAKTLMFSLHDCLRYLPMAALNDGHHYVVEKYRTEEFTPASIDRIEETPQLGSSRGVGMGVSKLSGDLPALPGVPEELHEIFKNDNDSQTQGIVPGRVILDDAFTKAEMKSDLQQQYAIVHIASHFVFRPGNELDSYLLLGAGGHLTLGEMRIDPGIAFGKTELLTLSACDTASGGKSDGREVDGLGMMAQRKGAKAVVASLWEVDDKSTGMLMADFYRHWLSTPNATKAEALRIAQIDLLRGGLASPQASVGRGVSPSTLSRSGSRAPYSHPYYWAPFILIGNWN